MKSDRGQSLILIGLALIIMSGVLLYVSLSQPRISSNETETTRIVNQQDSVVSSQVESTQLHNENSAPSTEYSTTYKININTATVDEIASVGGIGESKAMAIVEYREYLGGYESVEQIKDISGIGASTYDKISEYLTV